MGIATRIYAGYGILIALMIIVLVYQVSLIRHMGAINKQLTDVNFSAAKASLQLLKDLAQIDEWTRKFFVSEDLGYATLQKEWRDAFARDLQKVQQLARSEEETREIRRLSEMWSTFSLMVDPSIEASEDTLVDNLNQLKTQVDRVFQATQDAIQLQVNRSAEAGQQAGRTTLIAAATALVLSLLVSLLIGRSISNPLRQLTKGTHAIAEGNFSYQLNASGRDEVSRLARDFNAMAHRLGELDQMKKDLVSHVSHELKAPLASMQETIQLILEQIPGPLTEKQKRLLELNLQSGKRLSAMIANLLELSRLEAGVIEYEIKSQDLIELIRTAVTEYGARGLEKEIRVEVHIPPGPLFVACDEDRLIQVIGNLLENAMKFSPRRGVIGVRARLMADIPTRVPAPWRQHLSPPEANAGFAMVSIFDSGPGVPDQHKERIFQKFHQVERGKKISGQGVGLGLAICRTIVEAHHGAIWVEDNPAGGSVFSVLLPAHATGSPMASRVSSPI